MYRNLGVAWASSTLAFISIVFIPIPFLLYAVSEREVELQQLSLRLTVFQYGERLRKSYSRHARKDI